MFPDLDFYGSLGLRTSQEIFELTSVSFIYHVGVTNIGIAGSYVSQTYPQTHYVCFVLPGLISAARVIRTMDLDVASPTPYQLS